MTTVTIEEARNKLSELIQRLAPGEDLVITENDQPVARMTRTTPPATAIPKKVPQFGTLKGTVLSMEHFDDPLEEFEEYM